MHIRRKILTALLVIPLGFFLALLIWPVSPGDQHNLLELAALVLGTPIFVINACVWQLETHYERS